MPKGRRDEKPAHVTMWAGFLSFGPPSHERYGRTSTDAVINALRAEGRDGLVERFVDHGHRALRGCAEPIRLFGTRAIVL